MPHRLLMIFLIAVPAVAGEGAQGASAPQFAQTLPEALAAQIRRSPERFVEYTAGLILGFGAVGGIDAAGIEAHIGIERARLRSVEVARHVAADLNNDGEITPEEIAGYANALSPVERGLFVIANDAADGNRDGIVTTRELRQQAGRVAETVLTEEAAGVLRALMELDENRDGLVDLGEIRRAAALIGPEA